MQSKTASSFLRNEVEGDVDDIEKSELGSISIDAERALYRRKRAEQLARLLSAKRQSEI